MKYGARSFDHCKVDIWTAFEMIPWDWTRIESDWIFVMILKDGGLISGDLQAHLLFQGVVGALFGMSRTWDS